MRLSSFAADNQSAPGAIVQEQASGRLWSSEQTHIFDWYREKAPANQNLIVDAVAGSGKTTTIVEGVRRAPERNPLVCAFNKKIADELNSRLSDSYATAKTLHSLGYGMIRRQWRGMPVADESERQEMLTDAVTEKDVPRQIKRLISLLHTKAREMCPLNYDEDTLRGLALRFDYVPDEGWRQYDLDYIVESAKAAIDHAANELPRRDIGIDYADMVFLPLAWNLTSKDFDLVVVDEAQDMTMAQLEIAERVCNGRICIVGDRHQAIYGFRGADTASLDRLKRKLGAIELPLTTTYRCGTAIVERAQRLVPHIQAMAGARTGQVVSPAEYDRMMAEAAPGDFILSRINAPLVTVTLSLLRQGKRARMAGRDVGAGIMAILKRIKVFEETPLDFALQRLDDWEKTTCTRLATYGQVDLLARTHDQADMIRAFVADADTSREMLEKMRWLFSDVKEADQIICSSVHKAKGLEADRVWLLQESLYRRGETEDEKCIEYVAITRAKKSLFIVEGCPSLVEH